MAPKIEETSAMWREKIVESTEELLRYASAAKEGKLFILHQ